jgi:uncharacterized membrane protein
MFNILYNVLLLFCVCSRAVLLNTLLKPKLVVCVCSTFVTLLSSLAAITAPAEKKQMSMVSAAYDNLCEQASRGDIAQDVLQKVASLIDNLGHRNFPVASQIQAVRLICFSLSIALEFKCHFDVFVCLLFIPFILSNRIWRTQFGISTKNGLRV